MGELEKAVNRVLEAISDKGINPGYHDAQWKRLSQEWPTLWTALENLRSTVARFESRRYGRPDG